MASTNTIQIKRGSGKPASTAMANYELGFDYSNNILYINKDDTILPIGIDLTNGLPIKYGGTGAITREAAFNNIVAPGGTITKPIVLDGDIDEEGNKPGILVLNEDYCFGESDPSSTYPFTNPPTGFIYFKLINE